MGAGASKAVEADEREDSQTSQDSDFVCLASSRVLADSKGGVSRKLGSLISRKVKESARSEGARPLAEGHVRRERRIAYGSEVVRNQLRKGTPATPNSVASKADLDGDDLDEEDADQVSDSDEEQESLESTLSARKKSFKKQMSRLSRGLAGADRGSDVNSAPCQAAITNALQNSIVFRDMSPALLSQVVHSMRMQTFKKGSAILKQGAQVGAEDRMYLLAAGEVDVVISGGRASEDHQVEGNVIKIRKTSGWIFGDTALLFKSTRSASVVAVTDISVWWLDHKSFLKFVLHHAPGVRRLRFIRRLPMLKGLSDLDIIKVGEHAAEETFEDGQALVKHGEAGSRFFVIRYGKVRVMRPQPGGAASVEVVVLKRGQLVGERTLITGKLRSADCIADGRVTAVALSKQAFVAMDNPLLSWMLDYDAVAGVLSTVKTPTPVSEEKLDAAIELFEREEVGSGKVIIAEGSIHNRLYIVRGGAVSASSAEGQKLQLQEAGGFTYFGDQAILANAPSHVTVKVSADSATLLSITHSALANLLGIERVKARAKSAGDAEFVRGAMARLPSLRKQLGDAKLHSLAEVFELHAYEAGEIVAAAQKPADRLFVIKSGCCILTKDAPVDKATGRAVMPALLQGQRLVPGTIHSQMMVVPGRNLHFAMVAVENNTQVLSATREAAVETLGSCLELYVALRKQEALAVAYRDRASGDASVEVVISPQKGFGVVRYQDLTQGRCVGTGQFGTVRIVQHKASGQPYALKCIHKAPIRQLKQVEHAINERRLLQCITSTFCVRLFAAYQDAHSLMLLQEWVAGGELFHHLDCAGSFDEPTARFYTANVLVAMGELHAQGIIYRDLKPENLLIDAAGYVKMTDFGFAKFIGDRKTFTICGTPDYQAPEIITRKGTDKAADYWAVGVLIYEMLCGEPPFKSTTGDPWDTFRRALSGRFNLPSHISPVAGDLICRLLQTDPANRLGSGPEGVAAIRRHPWFAKIDFEALETRSLPAPMQPNISNMLDTSNYESFGEADMPPHSKCAFDKNAAHWDGLWDWIDEQPKHSDRLMSKSPSSKRTSFEASPIR